MAYAPVESKRASSRQVGGDHYRNCKIQPTEFIMENDLGWCEGNAIKYICRHKYKHKAQDIRKAIHYLELLLQWEYENENNNKSNNS